MDRDQLYLTLSQVLFSFIATQVVKRCINNPTMSDEHYAAVVDTLPPLSVPFPPNSTWGMIVDRMVEMMDSDDDPTHVGNIILNDNTVAPAIMGEELIQSLTNLAQNTRGYLSSVIYQNAQEICEKITSILSQTSLFNLNDQDQTLPMRRMEMVEWDILDHSQFVNSLVALGESLLGKDINEYDSSLISVINQYIIPPKTIGMSPEDTQIVHQIITEALGEESISSVGLLTKDIGIWGIIEDYKQSIYNASKIFDILDELTVAHALVSRVLGNSAISEKMSDKGKTFLEENLKRINLALLGIHVARKTIYEDIYFLYEDTEERVIYINKDNFQSAMNDDLSAQDIGDIIDYRHKRGITIPPQGLNIAALEHEKARAIASKIQTQAELATKTDNEAKGLYLKTAKTTLMSSLGKFVKDNKFNVSLPDLNLISEKAVWKMEENPDFPMKIVMETLVSLTPHQPLKIMMKYLEDVPRMTSLREDVAVPMLVHFVRGILDFVI